MRITLATICMLWVSGLLAGPITASAQSRYPIGTDSPQQWVSHQMHQPPPEPSPRNNLSQERIEEIRLLYELAKQEAEGAKTPQTPAK